ncbi:hypothetical protein WJX72_001157 [[Myrmecia] bisecta]|uniref:DNA polymerase theta n=1 Tax=[Myrmecia] bisecta TaxID=41462 RepID=A0AAW1Q4I0_9CHLO
MPNGFTKKPLRLGLDQWDLPPRVVQAYAGKGVRTMYPWQAAASECGEGGANLVYCAPTSGGKSLVAEVLMIRRLRATYRPWARQGMQRYGRALFVLPYVSVVAEKTAHLSTILQAMNCKVKGYMGNDDAGMPLAPRGESVAVCTIEKANVAINKLILEGRLGELCCVVIDEMHMVCDPSRGLPLELSITKLLYSPAMRSIQILGMSATMGGLEAMRTWLRARLFITNYRPVPLTEHAVFSGVVYKKAAQPQDDCPLTRLRELGNSHARDRDRILPLIAEVVADGDSVLVFCAGRKQCQSCAELVAELLPEVLQGGSISAEMAAQRALLIEEMKAAMGGFSNASLQKTMAAGVAWHHAGLTTEERHFVERGFRGGELCVLMATSTLAAGINLPARRVILRSLWQGIGEVSRGQYLQMVGRAGRAGHANFGEAFLMGRSEPLNEWDKVCALLVEPLPSLRSQLLPERVKADCSLAPAEIGPEATQHLQRMLMEALANGSVHGKGDFQGLLRCTLASHQLPYQVVHAHTVAALTALRCQKLITFRQKDTDEESRWHCTELGQAVYNSALPTAVGIRMYSELQAAQLTYVMGSSTHGIYLVMLDHPFQIKEWRGWDVMFDQLPDADKRVAAQVGVDKAYINKLLRSAKGQPEVSQRHHRFAAACALSAMVSEQPAWEAAQQWAYITQNGVSAGQLQKLQSDVSKWAAMAGLLCASAGWWLLELELMNLSQQAACGVRPELIKLMQIPEMTAPNARALYNAGFKDPDALVPADEAAVAKAVAAGMVRSLRNQKPSKDKAKRALESGITGAQGTNALAYRTAKTILTNVHAYLEEAAQQLADQEAELAECGSPDSSQ